MINNKIDILIPDIFPKSIVIAGVTKRSLNKFRNTGFSIYKADILTQEQESQNISLFANQLGTKPELLKANKQVHGLTVLEVDASSEPSIADGMVTDKKGVVIYVKLADCAGILLFDPIHKAVAALHSGWRGTKLNIAKSGVEKLSGAFNTRPSDLLAYITPAASGESYEVGHEVARFFPDFTITLKNGKYLFDNRSQIKQQLIDCGIDPVNIEVSEVCTIKDEEFHSFRRDGIRSGRMAAYIALI